MPLHVETFNRQANQWIELDMSPVRPGTPGGSFSNYRPDGVREVLHVQCAADDSSSTLSRAAEFADMNPLQRAVNLDQIIPIARITKDSPYELEVRTAPSGEPRRLRLIHRPRA